MYSRKYMCTSEADDVYYSWISVQSSETNVTLSRK